MGVTYYNRDKANDEKKPNEYEKFTYETQENGGCLNKFIETSKLILTISNDIENIGNNYTILQGKYDKFTNFNDLMNSNKTSLRNSIDNIKSRFDEVLDMLSKQVSALRTNDEKLIDDLEGINQLISNEKDQDKTISDSRNKNDSNGSGSKSEEDINKTVDDVINGKYGNGDERKEALKKAGYDPDEIQKRVNEKLKKDNNSTLPSSGGPTNGTGGQSSSDISPNPASQEETTQPVQVDPTERVDVPKETAVTPEAGFIPATGSQLEVVYQIIAAEGGSTNPAEAVNIASTMINRARSGGYGGGNNIYNIATAPGQYVVYEKGIYKNAYLSPASRAAVEQLFASCAQGGATPHNFKSFRSNYVTSYGGTILQPGGNRYK